MGLLDSLRNSTCYLSGFYYEGGAGKPSAAALTVPAEALQAVSQQLTVSVDPPRFVHHFVQLLVLVLSCKINACGVGDFEEKTEEERTSYFTSGQNGL